MSKIYKQVILTFLIVYSVLFILRFANYISDQFLIATFYSGTLNLINVALAVILFNSAIKKSNKTFLIRNVGGMTARMLGLLICIFVFFKFTDVDKYGFIVLFFVFYFVFLIFEINHFLLKVTGKNEI